MNTIRINGVTIDLDVLLAPPQDDTIVRLENGLVAMNYDTFNKLYRPRGEWKQESWKAPLEREFGLLFHYKCDNCDKEVRIDRIERYNYCPHCGADMRG